MKYRITVLTPLLVGDGQKLSPIDYMVWKDQVSVLDQRRIFRLLAKGPRLEGYLTQLRKAEKLDFASWGGFAQNFAGRRIPFEHASSSAYWQQARAEHLHIPTFAAGPSGPYLPGSAVKGALRTGFLFSRVTGGTVRELAGRFEGDRAPRRPGETVEGMAIGTPASDPLRLIGVADSGGVPAGSFKIYLLRVSAGSGPPKPEQSAPLFAEMAVPGTQFEGSFQQKQGAKLDMFLEAANAYAERQIALHAQYADKAGLQKLRAGMDALSSQLQDARSRSGACLLNLGWGGGFLSKAPIDTMNEDYRRILRQLPYYERAIRSGLPFPKTRKVVFLENQAATLPGWVTLEVLA